MTKAESAHKNSALSILIARRNLKTADIASALGVTQIYINSLRNGNREWSGIGTAKLRILARLLGIRPLMAFGYAGLVEDDDFKIGDTDRTEHIYDAMASDPAWAHITPSLDEWDVMPAGVRAKFGAAYFRAGAREWSDIVTQMQMTAPVLSQPRHAASQ